MAESPEEVAVLVQRVVKDINSAFKRNPHIDEIGLIPCPEARYNRSPIVLVENKLGVESWCVKFLLPYVHNKLLHYKLRKQWFNKEELIDITCTLLLLNPDFTTAWNVRRWVLQHLLQENSLPTLVTKGNLEALPTEKIQRLVKEEMDVCCDAAGRYPSNYNAWSHRIWVLQNLAKLNTKILLDELSSTKHWVSIHVSDHSGFHYRQFLLKSLIVRTGTDCIIKLFDHPANQQTSCFPKDEADEDAEAFCMEKQLPDHSLYLKEEIELCTDLINTYPGHETLWYHRRQVFYLQHHLKKCPIPNIWSSTSNNSDGTVNNSLPHVTTGHTTQDMDVDCLTECNKQGYSQETKRLKRAPMQDCINVEEEYKFIDHVLSTCKEEDQARFASSYRKWLVSFLGQ
uniref:Protein prenyltransferase alpha subunit repeat containing 1 n=1 Tax=Pseudonaja textilis TaxID=8673 RepID=A0A670ZYM0_PSETE